MADESHGGTPVCQESHARNDCVKVGWYGLVMEVFTETARGSAYFGNNAGEKCSAQTDQDAVISNKVLTEYYTARRNANTCKIDQ